MQPNPSDVIDKYRALTWTVLYSFDGSVHLLLKCTCNRVTMRQVPSDRFQVFVPGFGVKPNLKLHRTASCRLR